MSSSRERFDDYKGRRRRRKHNKWWWERSRGGGSTRGSDWERRGREERRNEKTTLDKIANHISVSKNQNYWFQTGLLFHKSYWGRITTSEESKMMMMFSSCNFSRSSPFGFFVRHKSKREEEPTCGRIADDDERGENLHRHRQWSSSSGGSSREGSERVKLERRWRRGFEK